MYEKYPGSNNDVSQLQYMIAKTKGYGYNNIGFILDRGYFSKENLKFMDENGFALYARSISAYPMLTVGAKRSKIESWSISLQLFRYSLSFLNIGIEPGLHLCRPWEDLIYAYGPILVIPHI